MMRWVVASTRDASMTVDDADLVAAIAKGFICVGPVVWDGTLDAPMGPYLTCEALVARPPIVDQRGRPRELSAEQRQQLALDGLRMGVERAGTKWGVSRDSVRRVMRDVQVGRRRPPA